MQAGTLDCNADLYWRIIAQRGRDKAIPFASIDKLSDHALGHTKYFISLARRQNCNVAEVIILCLDRKLPPFPTFGHNSYAIDQSFRTYAVGNLGRLQYIMTTKTTNISDQRMVKDWYLANQSNIYETN